LGDIRGLDVLYAGGSSPLWIEGLAERVGAGGSVTALELDEERIEAARELLDGAEHAAPVRLVSGSVFEPPFVCGSFDLVYSGGLFHELDVRERSAADALAALASVVVPGGRVATSDFVECVPAAQLDDEALEAALAREVFGVRLYGIGPPERLVSLHEGVLSDVRWRVLPPVEIRHLGRLVLAGDEPEEMRSLIGAKREQLRRRRSALLERVRREGYTRPATLYVEGAAGI
ncbi:MAG: methyltransferase domain-containing protein, partial [Actinomycetota bacterium]